MSYDLHIIRTSDYIRLDSKGRPNLEDSQTALTHLAQTCLDRGIQAVLLDTRDAHSSMTLADVYKLASTFQDVGFRKTQKVAILHPYRAGERAQFFAMLATDRGWNVAAFEEYEHAIDWLGTAVPVK